MADSPTLLNNIYQSVQDEVKDALADKLEFIRAFNRILFRMNLTKPAEQLDNLYFLSGFEKYKIPANGFREAIAIYPEQNNGGDSGLVIRYVSPFRYKLKDPTVAYTDQATGGNRYLMVRNPYTSSKVTMVTQCDNLTADGAWNISGGTSLAIDTITKIEGSGSVSFTINTAQCLVTFIRTLTLDGSNFTEFMRQRFYAWFPSIPTSVKIRIGNDASNYFETTVTKQADNEAFTNLNNNELEFSLENSTQTGTVDRSNLIWYQFELNFAAPINTQLFRLNHIMIGKPEIMQVEYYTNFVCIDSNGNLQQSITEDVNTLDEPIIKDYPVYVNTVTDGLCYDFLKIRDPQRAAGFYTRFVGEVDPNTKLCINGMGYLNQAYPSRRAVYKRFKNLPDLNYGVTKQNRNLYDNTNAS